MKRGSGCGAKRCAVAALVLSLAGCGGDSTRTAPSSREPPMSSEQETERGELTAAARCELPAQGYSPSCDQCLAARCCEPIEACKSDAECAEQVSCIVRCQYADDPASCSPACIADQPHPGYLAYDDCSFEQCLEECWSD